jgi:predicted ester cyclase
MTQFALRTTDKFGDVPAMGKKVYWTEHQFYGIRDDKSHQLWSEVELSATDEPASGPGSAV